MIIANVANVVSTGKDRILTVQYKGGEKKVLVPESAIIVSYTPTDRSELKPGAQVFVNSQRQPDGSLTGGGAIGAIGVSGAPGGQFDEECARAALAKIQDQTKSPREVSFTLRQRFASPPESNATSKLTLRA